MLSRTLSPLARLCITAGACALVVGIVAGCAAEPSVQPTPDTGRDAAAQPSAAPTTPAAPPAPSFDRTANSLDDPASLWVVVNKLRPIAPQDTVPRDLVSPEVSNLNGQPLREPAARATEEMVAAAARDGVELRLVSAYRSYGTQVEIYGGFVSGQGREYADTTSARPGFSEHQTGLAADFGGADECTLDVCFADTPAGTWLREYASEYGFTLRYPDGLEGTTGYEFEPWHYRYVGPELAIELRSQGIATLEEFFELPPAATYAE